MEVSFKKINTRDLKNFASLPQCLDNQWAPIEYIEKMKSEGRSRSDLEGELNPLVRRGFIRSLIQSEQVIINRAYYHTCPTIKKIYMNSDEREDLEKLISSSEIVTYLMNEESPKDEILNDVDKSEERISSWNSLCDSSDMHCVKLSWDSDENNARIRDLLGRRFQEVVTTFEYGDPEQFCRDFGLSVDKQTVSSFQKRLEDLSNFSAGVSRDKRYEQREQGQPLNIGSFVSRAELYEEFVCPEGMPPHLGNIDKAKPFSAEIKQLIDLRYNINLPDALDRFSVGATGSIERRVLQEVGSFSKGARRIDADELGRAIADIGFNLTPQNFEPISLQQLSLAQVKSLREDPLFDNYIKMVKEVIPRNGNNLSESKLLSNPDESLRKLSEAYIALIKKGGRRAVIKEVSDGEWMPIANIIVTFVGTALTLIFNIQGTILDSPDFADISISQGHVPIIVEYQLGRMRRAGAEKIIDEEFALRVPLLKAKTDDAKATFNIIRDIINARTGCQEHILDPNYMAQRRLGGHEPRDLEIDNPDD